MSLGIWQIALIVFLVVLLFGRGKISELMGDVAKGITSFKRGLNEPEDEPKAQPTIDVKAEAPAEKEAHKDKA